MPTITPLAFRSQKDNDHRIARLTFRPSPIGDAAVAVSPKALSVIPAGQRHSGVQPVSRHRAWLALISPPAHHVPWALPSPQPRRIHRNRICRVTGKPVVLHQMQNPAPPLGANWSPGFVWCAVGLEIRDACCGDWPTGRDCLSDGDDADEFLQSSEVIAFSSVEIEVIGVCVRGNHRVWKSAPGGPSFPEE